MCLPCRMASAAGMLCQCTGRAISTASMDGSAFNSRKSAKTFHVRLAVGLGDDVAGRLFDVPPVHVADRRDADVVWSRKSRMLLCPGAHAERPRG